MTEVTVLLSLAVVKNLFGSLQNEFSQINHALSEAINFTMDAATGLVIFLGDLISKGPDSLSIV